MLSCEVTEVGPERVGLDIGDDHRLSAVGGGAAGTGRLSDRDPVDRVVVSIWQARRGTVLEAPAVVATQQHGRPGAVLGELLGDADDRREHFGQRRSLATSSNMSRWAASSRSRRSCRVTSSMTTTPAKA